MTDGGGGGDGGGKTLGPILPFPLLPSLFSTLLFFYPEYEKLWMEPKGLGGDIKGHHSYCSITLRSCLFFLSSNF